MELTWKEIFTTYMEEKEFEEEYDLDSAFEYDDKVEQIDPETGEKKMVLTGEKKIGWDLVVLDTA